MIFVGWVPSLVPKTKISPENFRGCSVLEYGVFFFYMGDKVYIDLDAPPKRDTLKYQV